MVCLWKDGQVTQELFKVVAMSCRKKNREAKAQLELNLATSVKDNKKKYKYTNGKRRGQNQRPFLIGCWGNTVTKEEEKAEALNSFFASTFSIKTGYPQDN